MILQILNFNHWFLLYHFQIRITSNQQLYLYKLIQRFNLNKLRKLDILSQILS